MSGTRRVARYDINGRLDLESAVRVGADGTVTPLRKGTTTMDAREIEGKRRAARVVADVAAQLAREGLVRVRAHGARLDALGSDVVDDGDDTDEREARATIAKARELLEQALAVYAALGENATETTINVARQKLQDALVALATADAKLAALELAESASDDTEERDAEESTVLDGADEPRGITEAWRKPLSVSAGEETFTRTPTGGTRYGR